MLRRRGSLFVAASIALASHSVSAQEGGLPGEIQARQAGDTTLQTNIDAEAAARSAADQQLQRNIDAEAAARMSADGGLDARISAESAARTEAIEALRRSIGGGTGGGSGGGTANVDCAAGGSIGQALAAGATHIVVRGHCTESVLIDRDGVTLQAHPSAGGSIHGPDSNLNTVHVTGHRVTVEGLVISGGRNGVTGVGASNLTVRNVTVQSAGRSGIAYAFGSSGTIDRCTVQGSARDGIVVDSAFARLTNNTVAGNTRNGVLIVNNGNAQIGFTDRFVAAGNTVTQNGGVGISVTLGSVSTAAMNEITRNGSFGFSVFQATASIAGGNTISDNVGVGVSANGAKVVLGDAGPGFSTVNVITGNGNQGGGGVSAFLGSIISIRDAEILSNKGPGLLFTLRSQGQITSSKIQSNASDGIRLLLGSALLPSPSPANVATRVSGNAGFGIQCFDSESSVVNTNVANPPIMIVSDNAGGQVAFSCTSFDQPAPAPAPGPVPPPVP